MKPITRKAARALDLKKYFTGKPCGTCGKIGERHVRNANCVLCGHFKPPAEKPIAYSITDLDKLWNKPGKSIDDGTRVQCWISNLKNE